mgnify:FL=1
MKKNILLAMILASCGLFVACNGAGGQGSGETASKPMESTREQTEESVTASGTDGEPTAPATEEESSATKTGGEAGPAAETIVYREYDFSAEIQEWTPEKMADNIKSDDPAYVMAFQDPTVTPVKINKTGLQLHLNAPFSALTIGFPAWGVPDTFCTLSIYEWKGTYSATVAEKALLSVEVRDIVDCAFTRIELGRSMPAGNYLILLHDPGSKSNDGGPGIWNFQSNITAGQLYQDGKPIDGEMQLWVQFDKTPIKPFGLPDTTGRVAATRTEKEKAVRQFRTLMKSMSKFPVSFRVGDTAYNGFGRDFTELGRTLENTDTSETTTVRFLYKDSIEIKLICTLYPYHAAYEWTVYFTNIGNENSPAISEINGCNYTLTAANPHLSGILGDGGYDNQANTPYDMNISGMELVINNETGRATYNRFPYFKLKWNGGGAFFAVGWPGQWRAGFSSTGDQLTVTDGQVKLNTYLKPGQTIRTPLSTFVFYEGDDSNRETNLWRNFFIACNMRKIDGGNFSPATAAASSSTYEEMFRATDANQIAAIKKYHANGVKLGYWWMDAGWYYKTGTQSLDQNWLPTGTWYVDESRFPSKFRDVSDYAHSVGTKTILWFEPEVVRLPVGQLGATSVKKEWLLPKSSTKLVNYGNPEAREWLLERVCTVLKEGNIDLYRQDYGVAYPASEWQANDPRGQSGITENLYVQGYLWFFDSLIARFPNMMIDACAAGGGRNDLETMRRAVPLHKSDSGYHDPEIKMSMNTALFSWFPYFGTYAIGDEYGLRASFSSMPVLNYNVVASNVDWKLIEKCVNEWEQVKEFYYSDYYLLTEWNVSDEEWNAWEFFDPDKGAGFFQAFRPKNSGDESLNVRLHGLRPTATYRLTDTDGRIDVTVTGAELMGKGFSVRLPAYSSAVVLIREVG